MVQLQRVDEVKEYLDCRYVAACESCWRLFGLKLHGMSHSVVRLDCHLENHQYATFRDGEPIQDVLRRNGKTKLTEYFALCRQCNNARTLKYGEIPAKYSWHSTRKKWIRRKRNAKVVPRIYAANPSQGERFFLRLLLNVVTGPTSFDALRTHEGTVHPTYRAAAIAYGLL